MSGDSTTALRQKLYEIVLLLASEEGRIEERLARAWFTHIRALSPDLLPPDLRRQYEALCAELGAMYPEPGNTGAVDRGRAVELAQRIILIYDATLR